MPNTISNIDLERFRSGDILLFDYSQCGGFSFIAWVIRRVQKRLLADLGGQVYPGQYKDAFVYSHAALAGESAILEMTSPRARVMPYADIPAGTIIKVRRPRHEGEDINGVYAGRIIDAAWRDVAAARRYPWSELMVYWLWSWGFQKLFRKKSFVEVFRSDRADVCSGSVWRWCLEAGLFREVSSTDLRPEAWYPARLAADDEHFRTVGVWQINDSGRLVQVEEKRR